MKGRFYKLSLNEISELRTCIKDLEQQWLAQCENRTQVCLMTQTNENYSNFDVLCSLCSQSRFDNNLICKYCRYEIFKSLESVIQQMIRCHQEIQQEKAKNDTLLIRIQQIQKQLYQNYLYCQSQKEIAHNLNHQIIKLEIQNQQIKQCNQQYIFEINQLKYKHNGQLHNLREQINQKFEIVKKLQQQLTKIKQEAKSDTQKLHQANNKIVSLNKINKIQQTQIQNLKAMISQLTRTVKTQKSLIKHDPQQSLYNIQIQSLNIIQSIQNNQNTIINQIPEHIINQKPEYPQISHQFSNFAVQNIKFEMQQKQDTLSVRKNENHQKIKIETKLSKQSCKNTVVSTNIKNGSQIKNRKANDGISRIKYLLNSLRGNQQCTLKKLKKFEYTRQNYNSQTNKLTANFCYQIKKHAQLQNNPSLSTLPSLNFAHNL